jgi:hypothetical protein
VVSISRPFGDFLVSIGAVILLLAILIAIDGRVREQVSLRMEGATVRNELRDAGVQLRGMASVIAEVARDQMIEHAPMMILVLTGSVLVIFMLRV